MEVRDDGMEWHNCFAKVPGGWGKDGTSGGNWRGQASFRREGESGTFATWQEALENRYNPEITLGGESGVKQIKFRESAEFIAALTEFLASNV